MIVPTLQLGDINSQKSYRRLISENFALEHFPLHWIQVLDTSTILYLYMYEWIWKEVFWMENITRVFCIVLYCFFGFLVVAEMPKTSRFRAIKGLPCVCTLHAVIVNCIENEQCTRGKVCATPSIHPSVQWENVWKR